MNSLKESRRLAPEVQAAIVVFLKNYKPDDGPFAISEAIDAVRRVYPVLNLSNNDLTDAIAGEAVAAGLNIDFDRLNEPKSKPTTERSENESDAPAGTVL